jgi:hypothetical protein
MTNDVAKSTGFRAFLVKWCLCFLLTWTCGCEPKVMEITSATRLDPLVGKQVELVGTVGGGKVPQLYGVDLWGMEKHRGQRVRACGVLQRTVLMEGSGDTGQGKDSGTDGFAPPVLRDAGTYYRLQDMKVQRISAGAK